MTRSPRSRPASWSSGIDFAVSPLDALKDADAVVLVTEWRELLELDWRAGRERDARQRS